VTEFPAAPVSPQRFFGAWLPAALAEAGPLPGVGEGELSLGFCLEGEGGGAWACRLRGGRLSLRAAPAAECVCDITYIQRAADWQAAVWAGRGGALGAAAARLFRSFAALPAGGAEGGAAWLRALAGLRKLDGLVRLAITGGAAGVAEEGAGVAGESSAGAAGGVAGESGAVRGDAGGASEGGESAGEVGAAAGGEGGGDWELALRLGPGPILARRSCTLRASAEAADALARGEISPLAALLGGRIEVRGDRKLLLRLTARLRRAARA